MSTLGAASQSRNVALVDGPSATKLTVSASLGLNQTVLPEFSAGSSGPQQQWFWSGACVGSMLRLEAIPNRTYYATDGVTVQNPMDALAQAGFNAVRVQTQRNMSSSPTVAYNNSGNVLQRELRSTFDVGGIDVEVLTAGLAKERNMKVELTINMGSDIPPAWQQYNYTEMLSAIDGEVRRQLSPFLQAGIQPDIILFETENSVGLLYNVILPNGEVYARGTGNNKNISAEQVRQERCGLIPTGSYSSYPQLAGYYKQEINSCNQALSDSGFDPSLTRYGLHSQLKYLDWRQRTVYNDTNPDLELTISSGHVNCSFEGVIPDHLLQQRAADMLDIMGFSSYPTPIGPVDIASNSSLNATFNQLRQVLSVMDGIAERYGKYTSGPFVGQYKKQGLAVEYASKFFYPDQMLAQQQHTQMYFQVLQSYPWVLGALWFEPTRAFSDWSQGAASLYHKWTSGTSTNAAPTPTLAYWGSFSRSP